MMMTCCMLIPYHKHYLKQQDRQSTNAGTNNRKSPTICHNDSDLPINMNQWLEPAAGAQSVKGG